MEFVSLSALTFDIESIAGLISLDKFAFIGSATENRTATAHSRKNNVFFDAVPGSKLLYFRSKFSIYDWH